MAYKVLIVEDQDIPRQLFEIYIKASENFEHLLSISNASAAIEICRNNDVDLILDPEFESEKHRFFFGAIRNGKTTVTGWGVKVKGIKDARR